MVVTAEDGVDEISICSKTYVHELKNDEINQFSSCGFDLNITNPPSPDKSIPLTIDLVDPVPL